MVSVNSHRQAFRLDRVAKSYPGRLALNAISLEIGVGESIAVVGPSGSGKTTLLHLLAGVIQPDSGDIALNGHSLSEINPGRELSSLVGVIHQQYDLVPHLSVLHNVLAGRLGQWSMLRSLISLVSPRDQWLAVHALEQVGLEDRILERASRLSGGEQQRVAIARLLVQDPQVIIADEPVASLDPARAADLINMLARIARESNKTLISSIHSTDLAHDYFDRVIGLRNGELQFDLPAASVSSELLADLYVLEGLEGEGVAQK
ncbi:MAG: ATP-binding cassette domain-containing protein [SAR202 cluster bacterium]|nr:ATP-binding cassette domain-containing protein [SAR202 cluster bacterium]MDP6716568.1 ATP-binding cassette domain-containing protein [SAR202 cluster bacterium]